MTRPVAYAVLLSIAGPVAAQAAPLPQPAMQGATAPMDASTYLAKAAAGDQFEREASRLVLDKAPSPQVAAFARMMIEDHTRSSARLAQAAQRDGVAMPSPALDPTQMAALDGLRQAQGATAQQVYLAGQRDAHAAALALHRSYAETGSKPGLRAAAAAIAPIVAHHEDMLARLASEQAAMSAPASGR